MLFDYDQDATLQAVTVMEDTGLLVKFTKNPQSGLFDAPPGVHDTLIVQPTAKRDAPT